MMDPIRKGIEIETAMSNKVPALVQNPIFFERNRVFRVYRGGFLFHEFFGDAPEDSFFPEEWVASTVRALNKEPKNEHEGISCVRGQGIPFSTLVTEYRNLLLGERKGFDVLVKILDSAIRLPVQTHPDKTFAQRHLGSLHGKTEMWLILATREDAHIYFGFKEGVRKLDLMKAIRVSETDKTVLPSLLNELPVMPGDVYLIPARVAHALGAGCLILEVQEPTDFTIQPEAWCGDYRLSPYEMYLGLDEETALQCFDLDDLVGSKAIAAGWRLPRKFIERSSITGEHLITYADTPDFAVNRYRIRNGFLSVGSGPAVYVVTEGIGRIEKDARSTEVQKGDYFFLPSSVMELSFTTPTTLEIVECLPPRMS